MVEEAPLKVKDVDINKTVKDFKDLVYTQLNLSSQISKADWEFNIALKKTEKK